MIKKWETLIDKSREHDYCMIICNLVKILHMVMPVFDFHLLLIDERRLPQIKPKLTDSQEHYSLSPQNE